MAGVRPPLLTLAAAGLPLLAACGRRNPTWIPLAEGNGRHLAVRSEAPPVDPGQRAWTCSFDANDASGAWLSTEIRRDEWKPRLVPGLWQLPIRVRTFGQSTSGVPRARLEDAQGPYHFFELDAPRAAPMRSFGVGFDSVLMKIEPEEELPETARLSLRVGRGRMVDGVRRIVGQRYTGEGLSVWPGERLELEREVDGPTTLRFATTLEPLFLEPDAADEVLFRLEVDGREALVHRARSGRDHVAWQAVPLPGDGRRTVRLAFSVEGRFAFTSFLDPVLGPTEIGAPGARPWEEERPDLILFSVDTFRADNLAAYGNTLGVTPNLDELARRSLVFERAWSSSTYTLPGHASMFTGLYPRRAGIENGHSALPHGVETISGRLARAGYRTGAVTDKGYVSPTFGLDQGHAFFDGYRGEMADTRDGVRSFLDADDGRPVFLLVHSFHTHAPYEPSERTRRERGAELGIEVDYSQLSKSQRRLHTDADEPHPELARQLRALYLGGVVDFDREFGLFLSELEERGFFRNGVMILTSDHGEAFDENGEYHHAGNVWEAQTRVPLLVHGRGIAPGRNPWPASLVDVAPTLADLAGVVPSERWDGRSLLENDDERTLYLFRVFGVTEESTLGILDHGRKVMALETPEALRDAVVRGAYDLTRDPKELVDLAHGDATWPRELLRRETGRLRALMEPVVELEDAELDPAAAADLSQLGYAGGVGDGG